MPLLEAHNLPPNVDIIVPGSASRCRLLKLFREDFQRLETLSPALAAQICGVAMRGEMQRAQRMDEPSSKTP